MSDHLVLLFRLEAGLLAFILGFYALCARERRAPHITHTVYAETGLVMFAVVATLLALTAADIHPWLHSVFRFGADFVLFIAMVVTLRRVFLLANRDLRLRDDRWWLVVPGVKQWYLWTRRRKHARTTERSYEHQPLAPSTRLTSAITEAGWKCPEVPGRPSSDAQVDSRPALSATLTLLSPSYHDSDSYVLDLACRFLREGAYVQYTPCGRHPVEFLLKLKATWNHSAGDAPERAWEEVAKQVVTVDAYTPHFGFYDSIHEVRTTFLQKELGVQAIRSRPTFAGIHTATAEAFNLIKDKEQNHNRKPALVIFEATYALVDLESQEQYRRFLRHVIPSERIWGSMFTLIVESNLDGDSAALLGSYSDYVLDRLPARTPNTDTPR